MFALTEISFNRPKPVIGLEPINTDNRWTSTPLPERLSVRWVQQDKGLTKGKGLSPEYWIRTNASGYTGALPAELTL